MLGSWLDVVAPVRENIGFVRESSMERCYIPWQVCVGNHDRLLPGVVHSVWAEGWYGYNLEHETYIVGSN